ncbi:MAG: YfhO family protein, partial [Oceanihabitans sp.]
YSYGFLETFNLFIPRLLGGGNYEDVGKDSEFYQFNLRQGATPLQAKEMVKQTPTYWGNQPIVEAPAYVGAVIIFLFVFALFLVKGRLKWWLVAGTILSLLLSYGKNLSFLTDFFIDCVPLYNKFRAVTSIQVLLELCIPVLAIFGLSRLFNSFEKDSEKEKALKYTLGITAGIALFFLLFKNSLGFIGVDFAGVNDGYFRQNYGQQFMDAIREDRKMLYTQDAIRTLILVLLSAGTIFLFLKKKLSETLVVVVFAGLILFDLVIVDRRYVNSDNFVSALQVNKPYQANPADIEILKDTTHFRVFDVTDASARASYFHNSLSGYHAAKLKRYDELFDFHIVKNNMNVLNMLNTKYIIAEEEGKIFPFTNTDANGNAWFVKNLKEVQNANQEITALDSLNTKEAAVMLKTDTNIKKQFKVDSTATIALLNFQPNYLKYQTNNANEGFAVFSEIYYKNGWNAYINGKLEPYFNVNYILRGLPIPAGKHTVEFKFEPKVIQTGSSIALVSTILFGLLFIGGMYYQFKNNDVA